MGSSNFEIIQTMYYELKKEQENRKFLLQEKKSQIVGIDIYLKSLLSKEESDLQVFLPRKVEDIYHDVIEQNRQKKERLLSECSELEFLIHSDENKIEQLKNFLSETSMLHVKQLSIFNVQEKERQKIARDLHDSCLQNLSHLVHKIELSALYIYQDPVRAKLELMTVEKGIRKVIDEIRNNIFDLRPMSFDDLGIKDTIEKLLTVLNQENRFHILTDIDMISTPKSDSFEYLRLISIYRIIQECVENAIKHSDGSEIFIKLKDCGSTYLINVQDNGIGFDLNEVSKNKKYFGLSVINERIVFLEGKIEIDTEHGTSIKIEIPKIELSA